MFNIIPWHRPSNINIRRENNPLSSLQGEINRVFEDFFGDLHGSSLMPATWAGNDVLAPAVDIVENDKHFKVNAELPGMSLDDVDVTVNDSYLIIKGQKKESKEEKEENYVRRERYYGSYQRSIALPETANADKAKATFNKGALSIEIPKKEEAVKPPRKVEVKEAA